MVVSIPYWLDHYILKCFIHILCEWFWINLVWPCFLFSPPRSAPIVVFCIFVFLYSCNFVFPPLRSGCTAVRILRRLLPIGWPCLLAPHWPVAGVQKPRKQQTKNKKTTNKKNKNWPLIGWLQEYTNQENNKQNPRTCLTGLSQTSWNVILKKGLKFFSYTSSSTLHPRQRVSRSFGLA